MTDEFKGILEHKEDLRREILEEIGPQLKTEIQNQISGLADMINNKLPTQPMQHSPTQPMQPPAAAVGFNEILTAFKMLNDIQGKPPTIADQIAVIKEVRTAFAPVEHGEAEDPEDAVMGKLLDAVIAGKQQTPPQTPTQPPQIQPSQENEPEPELKQGSKEWIKDTIDKLPENQFDICREMAQSKTDGELMAILDQAGFPLKKADIPYAKQCLGVVEKKKAKGEGKK